MATTDLKQELWNAREIICELLEKSWELTQPSIEEDEFESWDWVKMAREQVEDITAIIKDKYDQKRTDEEEEDDDDEL